MNPLRPIPTEYKTQQKRGFALVMALSLLSLVFLLVISLINLVGTDLSLSEVRKERILAKAHARIGMMVAIGEIQKHLGPDTRISATADLLDERIVSGQNYESQPYDFSKSVITRDDLQWIDLNEDGQKDFLPKGQRYWTGVWKHRARRKDSLERAAKPLPKNAESAKTINSQVMYDSEFDPHPAVEVAWLVSGNEGFQKKLILGNDPYADDAFVELMDGVYPEDRNFNAWREYEDNLDDLYEPQNNPKLEKYWHPKVALFESTNLNDHPSNTTWILKAPLLSADFDFADDQNRENWADYLRGEPVLVPKTELHLNSTPQMRPSSGRLVTPPSYAYWVGDEGVKSKFAMDFDMPSDLVDSTDRFKRLIDANSVSRKPNFSIVGELDSSKGGFGIGLPQEVFDEELGLTSLGLLSHLLSEESQEQSAEKVSAHYHSITIDSFGVLADARTGGLKRDLSSAFLNDDDINDNEWDLEKEDSFWAQDFENFIYKHKESLYKTVPLRAGSGGNQWNDTASTELRFEEAILGGPRWSVLGAYHNLYASNLNSNSQFSNLLSDQFPRTTGDNNVVFDPDGDFLNYLDRFGNNLDQVAARYNFFEEIFVRAEPENHGLQPVLCEIKYSQVPTIENGRVALAMYPSVALWNPYSVKISLDQLFLEIPLHHAFLRVADPRDYDRWRKWKMYNCHALAPSSAYGGGGAGGGPGFQIPGPDAPPRVPPGYFGAVGSMGVLGPFSRFPFFLTTQQATTDTPWPVTFNFQRFFEHYLPTQIRNRDFNHDDKQEPGYSYWPAYDPEYDVGDKSLNSPEKIHNDPNQLNFEEDRTNAIPFQWVTGERPDQDNYKILASATNGRNNSGRVGNNRRERHLLLNMQNIILQAGEKAHFTVNQKQIWNFQPLLGKALDTVTPKEYLEVSLSKGIDQNPFVCLTGHSSTNPLLLKTTLSHVMGMDPSHEGEKFDISARRTGLSSSFLEPRGITMYSEAPYELTNAYNYPEDAEERRISKTPDQQAYLWKLGRRFDFNLSDGWMAFGANSIELSGTSQMSTDLMKGNGFRIRLQLPSNSKSVVLEQFNLRALVHSFQDGFGDNWTLEKFKGNGYEQSESALNPYNNCLNLDVRYQIKNETENYTASFRPYGTGRPVNLNPPNPRVPAYDYLDLYYLPSKVTSGLTLNDFNMTGQTPSFPTNVFEAMVPRINEPSSLTANAETSIGHYHHEMQRHGPMQQSSSAVLFEVPRMPLLSMIQFRHANLNNYSHGPSYSLGNSYASTQVGRYKVTGLVRGIDIVPHPAPDAFNPAVNDSSQILWKDPVLGSKGESFERWVMGGRESPWAVFKDTHNFKGTDKSNVRDKEVSQEHENVTLDHSFLNNRALLDGYFLSGLGSPYVNDIEYRDFWSRRNQEEFNPGKRHRPYRNPRLVPYLRTNGLEDWEETGYADLDDQLNPVRNEPFKYQTLAADLLLEGAFNVNSTSVDAWVSQLSALAGLEFPMSDGNFFPTDEEETVFSRQTVLPADAVPLSFVEDANSAGSSIWNEIRVLSKDEITLLAHCLVEQIKLRGPFLSYSDFVNRRVQAKRENVLGKHMTEWGWPMYGSSGEVRESRETMLGMRGAVQAAIAEAEINRGGFSKYSSFVRGEWAENPQIPEIPQARYLNPGQLGLYPAGSQFGYLSSVFGIHAFHWTYETVLDEFDQQGTQRKVSYATPEYQDPEDPSQYIRDEIEFGSDPKADQGSKARPAMAHIDRNQNQNSIFWRIQSKSNKKNLSNGEAPDSIMAIENLATAANKPGWLMQSDVLSPLAPVTSARSDTFVIRVMGETWSERDQTSQRFLKRSSKSWIELTVQRTPDYVKSDLDAPHRRPHEPFEDRNLNGYWDDDSSMDEHWLDLNENGDYVNMPDLPGVGEGQGTRFRDGLESDLPLNRDPVEEADSDDISIMGINQRFGRKFKIIKFRWLKEQDV